MAPQRKFLDELDTSSKSYKVKLHIAEKGRMQESEKKILYQYVILQDDKKNRMKLTLFGDQIEAYKEFILFRGNYDIANALIRPLDPQYRSKESDLPFQMTIGSRTLIQSLDPEGVQVFPKYQSLASIPKVSTEDVRHDILVIVLYAANEPRKIVTTLNKESSVRDLMVIDHSTDSPIKVCTWNDLSGSQCERLVFDSENFRVISITALRPITRKGFQLESSMSTVIIEYPEGEKAAALTEWARKHRNVLIEHQLRVTAAWNPPLERILTTISFIKAKKAAKTLPQEIYWIRVTASDIQYDRLRAYIGCSYCGKRTQLPLETVYACIACQRNEVSATYRATITFTASDGTGALQLTAFTENSVPLLGMSAEDIYHMKAMDDTAKFGQVANKLRSTYFLLKIGPTTSLEQNGVLQWGIKGVEMEDTITAGGAGSSSGNIPVELDVTGATKTADDKHDAAAKTSSSAAREKKSLSKTIKKETVEAYDSSIFSQEEEDACILAESMAAAEKTAQSSAGDSGSKRKRISVDDDSEIATPQKDVIEHEVQPTIKVANILKEKEKDPAYHAAVKGKSVAFDIDIVSAEANQAIKQEKERKRKALVFQDDDYDDL